MMDAKKRGLRQWLRVGLILAFALGCSAACTFGDRAQVERLNELATAFGYRPEDHIAQVDRCWDLNAHCGKYLYFTTALSQADVDRIVRSLPGELLNATDIDGYELFTGVNLDTSNRLTINGSEGLFDRGQLPPFKGYRWRFQDQQGKDWTVSYFPVAGLPGEIALDGAPLTANILSVLYQTK